MVRFTRRRLLQACGTVAVGALAGCSSLDARSGDPAGPKDCSTDPTGSPTGPAYVSAVLANPEGSDADSLNDETVVVETTRDASTDLSGHVLVYCGRRTYEFTDHVADVEPGGTVDVHSGSGEPGVDASAPPEYGVFVGSSDPLLADDGMQLTLRSPAGDILDSVRYPAVDPGERYVRSE